MGAGGPLASSPTNTWTGPTKPRKGWRVVSPLARLDFQHLLLAHGEPFLDGPQTLKAFAG